MRQTIQILCIQAAYTLSFFCTDRAELEQQYLSELDKVGYPSHGWPCMTHIRSGHSSLEEGTYNYYTTDHTTNLLYWL